MTDETTEKTTHETTEETKKEITEKPKEEPRERTREEILEDVAKQFRERFPVEPPAQEHPFAALPQVPETALPKRQPPAERYNPYKARLEAAKVLRSKLNPKVIAELTIAIDKAKAAQAGPDLDEPSTRRPYGTGVHAKDPDPEEDSCSDVSEPHDDSPTAQAEYVKKLKNKITERKERIVTLKKTIQKCKDTNDIQANHLLKFTNWGYGDWPDLGIGAWAGEIKQWMFGCEMWGSACGLTGKKVWKQLSPEEKKMIVSNLKGWLVQDDLDNIYERIPPNFRSSFLQRLVSMTIMKDCLELFFTDRFWYLNGMYDESLESIKETRPGTPLGTFLSAINEKFLLAEYDLAHHWRTMTVRLLNVVRRGRTIPKRDPTWGLEIETIREERASDLAMVRFRDPFFACMLTKQEYERAAIHDIKRLYKNAARLGMLISQETPSLFWRTLEDGPDGFPPALPKKFQLNSKELEEAHAHGLWENGSRLNGHGLIAIYNPLFLRTGGWDRFPPDRVMIKAEVVIEDPTGVPGDWHSSDEEALAKWNELNPGRERKRRRKGAKEEKQPTKGTRANPRRAARATYW